MRVRQPLPIPLNNNQKRSRPQPQRASVFRQKDQQTQTHLQRGFRQTAAVLRETGLKIGSTTGYTDSMMHIVVPKAAQLGYAPDFWISPDGVGGKGRPYPYMIFENLKALEVSSVKNAVKVGDTVSDIQEGVSAGVWSVGVVEGSSVLGLSQVEYEALTPEARRAACRRAEETFRAAGAHFVLNNLSQLPELLHMLG